MKADWILHIELSRFFGSKAEMRVRRSKGTFRDKIYKAVFSSTLREEFSDPDIKQARKSGLIAPEVITVDGQKKTVYLWLEHECVYQPVFYKRWLHNLRTWVRTHLIVH